MICDKAIFSERLVSLRMKKDVSARDNTLREAKGFTARGMSLSLGQSAGYINKIENNCIRPSMDVFFEICEELGVSPKDFLMLKITILHVWMVLLKTSKNLMGNP